MNERFPEGVNMELTTLYREGVKSEQFKIPRLVARRLSVSRYFSADPEYISQLMALSIRRINFYDRNLDEYIEAEAGDGLNRRQRKTFDRIERAKELTERQLEIYSQAGGMLIERDVIIPLTSVQQESLNDETPRLGD